MTTQDIINLLKERETEYSLIHSFSKLPGIYAFFFIGNGFPLFGEVVSKHQIVYIGKTESSQEQRDAKTHFTSGKTGSSTVRKSIGALLCSQKQLNPIPRNTSDYSKGRFSHFKFDFESENIITEWMKNNLAVSFYEYPESKQLIDALETKIIHNLKPILNIDYKNPDNPHKEKIKALRKECAKMAFKNAGFNESKSESYEIPRSKTPIETEGMSASGTIFIDNITDSDWQTNKIRITVGNKHLFPSEKKGNPVSYSLNFRVGNADFIATYRIGSKDGKSRSGVLKLGEDLYHRVLKIQPRSRLKISKSRDCNYTVERL